MVQNHIGERKFIKGEISELIHARLTNWGLIIVAFLSIALFIVFASIIPYLTIKINSSVDAADFTFYSLAFGSIIQGEENVGAANGFMLAELFLFIIAAVLPIFFKKHIKNAVVISSIILFVDAVLLFLNWSNFVLELSLNDKVLPAFKELEKGPANNPAWNMQAGFVLLAALPIVTFISQWIALGVEEKIASDKLVKDVKFGKKLLNY